ncbi:MAG: bacteriocin fulvocin C-related protein [Gemmatimonadota bacterium]
MRHEEIVAWVEAHRDKLPRTLAELSTFPIPFRKVVVNAASHEQRLSFWREHFRTFTGEDSSLNAEQRAFVLEASEMLPELFGGTRESFQARAREFEERMLGVFSREQAGLIFAVLGPPEPPGGLPLPPDAHPSTQS